MTVLMHRHAQALTANALVQRLPTPAAVHLHAGFEAARVHSGFMKSLNTSTLLPNLTSALVDMTAPHPPQMVFVLGHSLGGALAALAAPLWKATLQLPRVQLWTFGCPRVGNPVRTPACSGASGVCLTSQAPSLDRPLLIRAPSRRSEAVPNITRRHLGAGVC